MESDHEGFIIEYHKIGGSVRVTAFDPVSLKEAVIIGPASLPKKHLAEQAIKKLLYMQDKES